MVADMHAEIGHTLVQYSFGNTGHYETAGNGQYIGVYTPIIQIVMGTIEKATNTMDGSDTYYDTLYRLKENLQAITDNGKECVDRIRNRSMLLAS